MRLHLAFALMWIIANPASGWAQSAPVSDTVLRAAYCLGVLSEAISSVKRVPGDVASSETAKAADFFDEVSKPLEQKRQRYYQYLAVPVIIRRDANVNLRNWRERQGRRPAENSGFSCGLLSGNEVPNVVRRRGLREPLGSEPLGVCAPVRG
jgi:hypothetical protein